MLCRGCEVLGKDLFMEQILIDKDGNVLETIENISETEIITMPAYTLPCRSKVK